MITSDIVLAEIAKLVGQRDIKIDGKSDVTELITDSIDLIEVVLGLQEKFGVHLVQDDLRGVETFAELSALVLSRAADNPAQASH